MSLAGLLASLAKRMPDQEAVTDRRQTRSYSEFGKRVGSLAGSFSAMGLRPGDRVALCMENCGEFLEGLFACWTVGLCAVPINAKLHAREVEHIVTDAEARILITSPALVNTLAFLEEAVGSVGRVICAQTDSYDQLTRGECVAPLTIEPTDPAWIFYTSGTTGRPKGAILTHRNLLFMCLSYYADIDRIDRNDVKLHLSPLSHASGLYAIPHMLRGSHQIIEPAFDISVMADVLVRHRNVTMFAAPTMLSRLVRSPVTLSLQVDSLKTIYYGGGPMYVADLERALSIFGPRLYQIYGQGESPMTVTGLSKQMHVDSGDSAILRTCGVARTGVSIRVVDEHDNDLPIGEVGEVVTRSDCVMSGYWNSPEATAQTLRGGWLHTGDMGSLDSRGFLTLHDRSKDLIISGGSNIYPREIEEVLLRHPDVVEVSVVGRKHSDWGEEVVAFVVTRPGAHVDVAELDAVCLDNIARFKRPRVYKFVEGLPKNSYGKVLKKALRETIEQG